MKCPKCSEELVVKVASKIHCEKCKILTGMTTVLTIQCDKCRHIFQMPVQSKGFFSVGKDK